MNNGELAKFCIEKLGIPYVMGTNGKILTQSMYNDLVKRNPGKWFAAIRLPKVKSYIGQATTDCHGLIEWFVREQTGQVYDTTADIAYNAAITKGEIKTMLEMPGICVRYPGHVGVYIGGGYVIEARGFGYGVCLTKLSARNWTHWYKHYKITYSDKVLPLPEPTKVNKTASMYSIIWLQVGLNRQIDTGVIKAKPLVVDGAYGKKTAEVAAIYWQMKGWTDKKEIWSVGANTVKALSK